MSTTEKPHVHAHHSHHLPTHMPALPGSLDHSYPQHEVDHRHYEYAHDAPESSSHDDTKPGGAVSSTPEDADDASVERTEFPNPWARFRYQYNLREYFAEFLATMLMICFGNGVDCQVVLSNLAKGSYLSISFGWGIGVNVAGGISGGHLNPVVTLSLACFRGFPRRKVLGYIFAQVLGAFCGALIIQGVYSGALNAYEGGANVRTLTGDHGTAALFFTAPAAYMTNAACFFSEFMDTAILIIFVFAIGDKNNSPPPPGMAPIALLFLILGIGAAMGWQTAYCLNPARDFGPRLALWVRGYPRNIWTDKSAYWIWTPIIATTL
ncbi:hypothetical protein RQP46_005105 [Phenoliferia psychrophenolica]